MSKVELQNIQNVAAATGLMECEVVGIVNDYYFDCEMEDLTESEILGFIANELENHETGIGKMAAQTSLTEGQILEILDGYWLPADVHELSENQVRGFLEDSLNDTQKAMNERFEELNESVGSADVAEVRTNLLVRNVAKKSLLNEGQVRRIIANHPEMDLAELTESEILRLAAHELFEACAVDHFMTNKKADTHHATGIDHTKHPASVKGIREYRKTNKDSWAEFFAHAQPGATKVGANLTTSLVESARPMFESKDRVSEALRERFAEKPRATNSLLAVPAHMV